MQTVNYFAYGAASLTTANNVAQVTINRKGRIKEVWLSWIGQGGGGAGYFSLEAVKNSAASSLSGGSGVSRLPVLGQLTWSIGTSTVGQASRGMNADVPVDSGEMIYVHLWKQAGSDLASSYVNCMFTVQESE